MNERSEHKFEQLTPEFLDEDSVSLVTELTGLIPSPPGDWDETVSFTELAGIPPEPPKGYS